MKLRRFTRNPRRAVSPRGVTRPPGILTSLNNREALGRIRFAPKGPAHQRVPPADHTATGRCKRSDMPVRYRVVLVGLVVLGSLNPSGAADHAAGEKVDFNFS